MVGIAAALLFLNLATTILKQTTGGRVQWLNFDKPFN